jgi:hypothetical protein
MPRQPRIKINRYRTPSLDQIRALEDSMRELSSPPATCDSGPIRMTAAEWERRYLTKSRDTLFLVP